MVHSLFEHLCNFRLTSEPTPRYNCIAWAAGVDNRWWWPAHSGYWPPGVRREEDTAAFEEVFRLLGYLPCDNGELEVGFEKVAIYTQSGAVTHMARQTRSGWWTSKLGKADDIEHGKSRGIRRANVRNSCCLYAASVELMANHGRECVLQIFYAALCQFPPVNPFLGVFQETQSQSYVGRRGIVGPL